jgi:hypothetical protein
MLSPVNRRSTAALINGKKHVRLGEEMQEDFYREFLGIVRGEMTALRCFGRCCLEPDWTISTV